jgi:hypothetical protein
VGLSDVSRRTYEHLLETRADLILQPHGFRRRGKTWRWTRPTQDQRLTNIIDVQNRSRFDWQYDEIGFTLNWAIFVTGFPEVARAAQLAKHPDSPVGHRPAPKRTTPRTAAAPFYLRIGRLSTTGHDLWWTVSGEDVTYRESGSPPQPLQSAPDALLQDLIEHPLLSLADRQWTAPGLLTFVQETELLLDFGWDRSLTLALLRDIFDDTTHA